MVGIHNGSVEYAKKMVSIGFNLVTVGSDQRFIGSGSKVALKDKRYKKNLIKRILILNGFLRLHAQSLSGRSLTYVGYTNNLKKESIRIIIVDKIY